MDRLLLIISGSYEDITNIVVHLSTASRSEATEWHMKNGLSRKEAEAMVSMDLGHGDGRGSYISKFYMR